MPSDRIVCIVGPTACHKTECSILLAERTGGEIVSADSVQVYEGMDIGSAKPTPEEQSRAPHHMIGCVPIGTPDFSVSQYRAMASDAIHGVLQRNHVPIVVGGSGLYVNALTFPLGFAVPKDKQARNRMEALYEGDPAAAYEKLAAIDPETAGRLHPNDKKRIVRALEVFECSGKPLSAYGNDFSNQQNNRPPFEPLMIGLTMDRAALYHRIGLRVDAMLKNGLVAEAEAIYQNGYDHALPAMQSIGYRQLFSYFDGNGTLEEAVETIKQDTRRFAKRQMTWFKRDKRIQWHDVTDFSAVSEGLLGELVCSAQTWMKGTNRT